MKQKYIGDGVYAEFSGYDVRLYTQEGNEIFLEEHMLKLILKIMEEPNES